MDLFGAADSLLGGVGSYLSGQAGASASKSAAEAYGKQAAIYGKAAQYSQIETGIKEQMLTRNVYQTISAGKAAIGASGLKESGSAADVIRSSAQQGALSAALVKAQGDIEYTGFLGQQENASAQQQSALQTAKSQKSGGTLGLIGGIIGGIASIFSDDRLKTDIEFLRRREDGLGIYRFRFNSGGPLFEGVLASEVLKCYPDAVVYDDLGTMRIDYASIGVEFRQVGSVS